MILWQPLLTEQVSRNGFPSEVWLDPAPLGQDRLPIESRRGSSTRIAQKTSRPTTLAANRDPGIFMIYRCRKRIKAP